MTTGGGLGGAGEADTLYIRVLARLDEVDRQLDQMGDRAEKKGDGIGKRLGGALSAGLGLAVTAASAAGAAIVAGLGAAVDIASQAAAGVRDFKAELGASQQEAEALGEVAKKVFGNNWGESLADAQKGVLAVRQQLRGLKDADLQSVTEGAFAIKDAFGAELPDTVSTVKTLMENFGLTSQQALDFVSKGFQEGLDRSGDFLDTINEYSTQFKNGGASAEQFFSLLESGTQGGVLGTDKAADAFKEFRVRIQDGSKTTSAGLKQLGIDADDLADKMASGQVTAADAFQLVVGKLREQKDANVQMQAGVALLGTQYEDLGQKGGNALTLTGAKMKDLQGATASVAERSNSLGAVFQTAGRQLLLQLEPAGKQLLSLANDAMPAIKAAIAQVGPVVSQVVSAVVTGFTRGREVVQQFAPYVSKFVEEFRPTFQRVAAVFADFGRQAQAGVGVIGPVVERVWAVLRPIFVALGPLVAAAFELIQAAWNNVLRPVLTAVAPYFEAVFKVVGVVVQTLIRVVTGVIHAIAALFKGDFREAGKAFEAIWEQLKGAVIKIIATMGQGIMGTLQNILPGLTEVGQHILDGLVNGLKAGLSRVVDAAKNIGSSVINTLKGVLGIASPSRVMKELGAFTSEGFVQGVASKDKDVKAAAVKIGQGFAQALKDLKLERELGNIDLSTYTSTLSQVAASLKTQLGTVKEGTPAYSAYAARLVQVQKELTSVTGKTDTATQSQLAKNKADLEASIRQDAWVASLKNATTAQLEHAQATARAAGDREKYDAITTELTRREEAHTAAVDKARDAVKAQADELARNRASLEAGIKFDAWVKGLEGLTDQQLKQAAAAARAAGDQQRYSAVMDVVARRAEDARTALEGYNEALRQGIVNSDVSLGQVRSDPNGAADGARGYTPPQPVDRLSLQDVLGRVDLPKTEAQVRAFTQAMTDLNTTGHLQAGVFDDLILLLPKFGDGVIRLGDAYADQEHFLEDNLSAFDQLRDAYASGRLGSQELHDKAVELSGTFAGLAANFERTGDVDLADLFRRAAREAQGLAASVTQVDAGFSHLAQTVVAENGPGRVAQILSQARSVAEGTAGRTSLTRPPSEAEDGPPRRVDAFQRGAQEGLNLAPSEEEDARPDLARQHAANKEALDDQRALTAESQRYSETLRGMTVAQLAHEVATKRASGTSEEYQLALGEQDRRAQSWQDNLSKMDFQKWTSGLSKMTVAQLEQAKAAAEASQDTERYNAVVAELQRRQEFANKPIVVGIQAVSQLAGAFAELAGAIGGPGGNDLQANLSGFTNLLGKGLSIAQDFASGNIVGGITKVISLIAEAIGGYQRAYAEADRLRKQFADSISPLLNPEDFSKTFVRSRGFFADLFGGGPEVVQEIDKVGLSFAESIAGGIESGFKSGLKKAILSGNINDFHDTFKQEVGSGILDGMIDAFLKQAVLQELLAGPIKAYVEALKTADPNDDVDALNALLSKTDEAMALGDKFFAGIQPVREKLAGAGYISGPAPAGSIADLQSQRSQLQAQFDQATTDKDRRDLKAKIDDLDRKISALQGQDTSGSASTGTSSGSGPITISGGTAATDTSSSGTISTAPLTVDFSPITLGGADIKAGGADIRAGASEFRQAVSDFMSGRGSNWTPLNTQG